MIGSGFHCYTADGVRLAGSYLPGPENALEAGTGAGPAFVIGHGFTHGTEKPATVAVLKAFAEHGAVSAADFRGHGRSAGRSSAGRDETLDLDAVLRWTRARGHSPITVVGFSMGAAVALRHAAIGADPGDAVVSVSSPARWYVRESPPMRRLQYLLESPLRRIIGRAVGVRLGAPWLDLPASPVEAVGAISRPVLLVHGTNDAYFTPAHAMALHRACGAEMWIKAGMGHGETATTPDLVARIAAWSSAALIPGAAARP